MIKDRLLLNFIVFCIVGLGIYIAQHYRVQLPLLLNNYLNDFLIIPIVLTICLYILRFTRDNTKYTISSVITLLLCVFYSLFFEVLMPRINERYTADFFDVIAYFSGGFWFFFVQRKTNKQLNF